MDESQFGKDVKIDPSSSVNNVLLGFGVKIAKRCSIYGSEQHKLRIGDGCYIGMNSILNGYHAKLKIGNNVSIAPNVHLMTDSGPNASIKLQQFYPLEIGEIDIGDDSWIGANSIIMPGVTLGVMCVVAANSFVNKSFDDFSIIGGNPARLLKKIER